MTGLHIWQTPNKSRRRAANSRSRQRRRGGEQCVCELTELVGADMSTVSKHLSIMKAAGLVEVEKRGLNVFYRLRCNCLGDFFRCVDSINRGQMVALQRAAA